MSDQWPDANARDAKSWAAQIEFSAVRGQAIQAYAALEQSLCQLFAMLAGTADDVASIIFFRIVNTGSRNAILKELFQRKYGRKFTEFRNSLIKSLTPIDNARANIVHWNIVHKLSGDEVEVVLKRPGFFYDHPSASSEWDTVALINFINKCSFYTQLSMRFYVIMSEQISPMVPEDQKKPWLEIFQQPIVYPPSADHPFFQKPPAPENPPKSSPA